MTHDFPELPPFLNGKIQTAWMPENTTVFETRLPYRRRVNNGHHLFKMPIQKMVEQHLVPLLEHGEIDIFLKIRRLPSKIIQSAFCLLFDG